ncbi:hypothetical protein [Roseivirga seohaensis]|uniref:hypothetical protein n=1 Tax=Roseivirga seohaensis TaxID=1914963 RepID=UPI003BABAD51
MTVTFPLYRKYEGNSKVNPAKGHLFEKDATKSLCGLNIGDFSHLVQENTYETFNDIPIHYTLKQCAKCRSIAIGLTKPLKP